MCDSQSSESPQVKVMLEWGKGFEARDVKILEKYLHDDFRAISYPRSLELPEQNKEQWLQRMTMIIGLWTEGCKATIHSITEAPGKVVAHITSMPKTSFGQDLSHEAINIAHIVPDGDGNLKIKTLEVFIDSKAYLDFTQALLAAKANQ